jgi:glycosyltransferase involved in cell wall biosynthesis
MKISIITAVYNRADTIGDAMRSVQAQAYEPVEHVIVDGASRDRTRMVIEELRHPQTRFVSEPDEGIYDAINKGMRLASGDILGLMHSDDVFAHDGVLRKVAAAFADPRIDMVYGDLHYVSKQDLNRVIRVWRAGEFTPGLLARGWMPPHPTLYVRRSVIERHGGYDTSYRIAADYDAVLRWFGAAGLRSVYIPDVLVKMRIGGESNRSLGRLLAKSREDLRALRKHGVGGLGTLAWKNVSKIGQFTARGR